MATSYDHAMRLQRAAAPAGALEDFSVLKPGVKVSVFSMYQRNWNSDLTVYEVIPAGETPTRGLEVYYQGWRDDKRKPPAKPSKYLRLIAGRIQGRCYTINVGDPSAPVYLGLWA